MYSQMRTGLAGSRAGRTGGSWTGRFVGMPTGGFRAEPSAAVNEQAEQPLRGFVNYTPSASYKLPIPRGTPLPGEMRQNALRTALLVGNPTRQMFASLPWTARSASDSMRNELLREGGIQARGLGNYQTANLNLLMHTNAPMAQLQRQEMAANAGADHANLIRQMDAVQRMREAMRRGAVQDIVGLFF